MRKSMKIALCLLFLAVIAGTVLPVVFSAEEKVIAAASVTGEITKVDVENSLVGIRQLNLFMDIYVDDATVIEIERDYEATALIDLVVGEKATVEYGINDKGEKVATYIFVNSKEQ